MHRWDYGYQTTAMANRTVIVDNNTWNNTHIATVGRAMASPEEQAWHIYRSLDVNYVFVVFGGFIGCAAAADLLRVHAPAALQPVIAHIVDGVFAVNVAVVPYAHFSLFFPLAYPCYRFLINGILRTAVTSDTDRIPDAAGRYPSDDINKFLWMVRIGGGVFPDIKEKDFLGEGGYRVDDKAGKVTSMRTSAC